MDKAGLMDLEKWTMLLQIFNFFVLFFVLKKILFKPVSKFMQERRDKIENSIKIAEDKNKEAEKMRKEYEQKVQLAEQEGREIVKAASKRAEVKAEEIVKEAADEASKIKERARVEMERQNQQAVNKLKDEVASIAIMAAGKVINKNLDEKSHQGLIKEFISEVGDAKWQS